MTTNNDDLLLERLRQLPGVAPDDLLAARVRRGARMVFLDEAQLARRPWLHALERAWERLVMPALVTGAVGVYLVWAFETAAGMYR